MGRKKKSLHYLHKLVHHFKAAERKALKQYLSCFDPNFSDSHRVKTLLLLESLESSPTPPLEEEVLQEVYGEEEKGNLKFLRLRLRQKIYESMMLEVNLSRKGAYSPIGRVQIELRKKLLLARILWGRNLTDELGPMLQKIIKKAGTHGLYAEQLEALQLKQEFDGHRKGLEALLNLQPAIELAKHHLNLLQKLRFLQSRLSLESAESAGRTGAPDWLEEELSLISREMKEEAGPVLRYHWLLLRLSEARKSENFNAAAEFSKELVELLQSHSAIFPKRKLGIAFGQSADNELLRKRFDKSVEFARKAGKQFKNGSLNKEMAVELEARANFYLGNARTTIELLGPVVRRSEQGNSLQMERRSFLVASAFFLLQKFREADKWLKNSRQLLKDKSGWNLGVRLLSLMILIERDQQDQLDLAVDAFRKHVTSLQQKGRVQERFVVIMQMVNRLRTSQYDFQSARNKNEAALKKLNCPNEGLGWKIGGPEFIPFEGWYAQKQNGNSDSPGFFSRWVLSN